MLRRLACDSRIAHRSGTDEHVRPAQVISHCFAPAAVIQYGEIKAFYGDWRVRRRASPGSPKERNQANVPSIEMMGTGRLDERDSAFPQAVQLVNGDVLCSFSVGGGPEARGGTDLARSTDGGETWTLAGTILASTAEPYSTNFLKLSLSADRKIIYAYGARSYRRPDQGFGEGRNEAVFCTSTDGGYTWSAPTRIPMPVDCPLEISHGILPLTEGHLLAPAATLPAKGRLGEQVLVAISDDEGATWPSHAVVFQDTEKRFGYFEPAIFQHRGED